jgi:hypothetical protein
MSRTNVPSTSRAASTFALALATGVVVFSVHRFIVRDEVPTAAVDAVTGADAHARSSGAFRRPASASSRGDEAGVGEAAARPSATQDRGVAPTPDTPETFRNTSILIAIRDAGFVCSDIIAADGGADDMAAWRVVCDGALVYLVGVEDSGALAVDPVPYAEGYRYFDPEAPPLWLEQPQGPPRRIERQFSPR